MSLPDTIFIFVLALIIFGPKRLPEIGRQLGKLVGEFRRASNEFKFQIEEELRQVDVLDKRGGQPSIAAPAKDASRAMDALSAPAFRPVAQDPAENPAASQNAGTDSVDRPEIEDAGSQTLGLGDARASSSAGLDDKPTSDSAVSPVVPSISPAAGSQPRTAIPYAAEADGSQHSLFPVQVTAVSAVPQPKSAAPAEAHSSPAETEIAHG